MNAVTWYKPQSPEEAAALTARDAVRPHGGGTYILRTGLDRIDGLVDLSSLGFEQWRPSSEGASIGTASAGAMMTLSELYRRTRGTVLGEAALSAATTPLRNRITIGGTVAAAPPWSDIMGPLIALDARVTILSDGSESVPVCDYLSDRKWRNGLISEISIPAAPRRFSYHRETRTRVDYPAFTVTVLGGPTDEQAADSADSASDSPVRIVVWGCKGRWKRLTGIEKAASEAAAAGGSIEDFNWDGFDYPDFSTRPLGSGEYLNRCARTAVKRGVQAVLYG